MKLVIGTANGTFTPGRRRLAASTVILSSRHSMAPFQSAWVRAARMPSSMPSCGAPVNTAACQPWNRSRSTSPRLW